MTGVLRDELGYKGVIVTDSLAMQGVRDLYGDAEVAVRALLAGVDQLLMTPAMDDAYAAVLDAVRSGRISRAELDAKVRRVLSLKYRRGIVAQPVRRPGRRRRPSSAPPPTSPRPTPSPTARRPSSRTTPGPCRSPPSGKKVLVTGYGVGDDGDPRRRRCGQGGDGPDRQQTGTSPTDAQVAAAVAAAADKDVVVVTTMKAWDTSVTDTAGRPAEARQAAARDREDRSSWSPSATPTTSPTSPAAPTYLATYSYSPVAIEAVARVIAGDGRPDGKLPVDIPVAGDPNTVLYPFGHGLTY